MKNLTAVMIIKVLTTPPFAADSPFSLLHPEKLFPLKGPAFTAYPQKRNNKAGWAGKISQRVTEDPAGPIPKLCAIRPSGAKQSLLAQSKRDPLGNFARPSRLFLLCFNAWQ
jgi:hypothetical protein